MAKKTRTLTVVDEEWELSPTELAEEEYYADRTVVLRKEPLPRKRRLMAEGVKEVRCIVCERVKPIADAEELGDRWICGDCVADAAKERRRAG